MRKHALILGAAAGAFFAPAAFAQQTGTTAVGVDEVVITAERRESTAQRTALSVTALGAEELENRGVTSPQDLVSAVPGVKVTNGTINLNFSMRGVGTSQSGPLGLGGVAAYMDGIYMNRPLTSGLVFDLSRIEVLAGPQGTLYGRGATGGAINFVHNRPTHEFGGRAQVTYGNYDAVRAEVTVNAPITDWLAARVTYQRSLHDGYYSNGYQDQDGNGAHIQVLATPTEKLSVLFAYLKDHTDETGSGQVVAGTFSGDPYNANTNALGRIKQDREHYLLQADYDTGPVTLTYLGALSEAPIPQVRWVNNGNTTSIEVNDSWNQQEVRASSNGDGRLQWTTGLFYLFVDQDYHSFNHVTNGEQFTPLIENESVAVYGQATFSLTDALRLTGGLRWSRDDTNLRGSLFQPTPTPITIGPFTSATTSEATNWKAGVEWDIAAQSLLYANVGDGYRPGGINQVPPPNVYQPETVKHYEIGSKNRFLGGRLQLNGALFYDKYDSYFLGAVAAVPGFPTVRSFQVTNAGEATIKGATLDLIAALTENDTLGLSLNTLDAKFDRFVAAGINYAGDTLPNSPELSVNFGYEHEWPLPGGANITARLDHYYSGEYSLVYNRVANVKQAAFGRTDVRVEYESPEGKYSIALFGKNLQDERVLNYAGVATAVYQSYDPPKTFGVTLGARF